ncbi:galactose mutarotase-like domain-containing protein [Pilobolus umbonatus]|nr:galactose mutarotase-like domain-containing protein [Pilobolus umbonatus]
MSDDIKAVLAMDEHNLPTGEVIPITEVPWMNFSGEHQGKSIGMRMEHLGSTHGYDHPYVIHTKYQPDTASLPLRHVAEIYCPETGIELDFSTTDPTFQFYTGGWIANTLKAKKDQGYVDIGPSSGFCLEASRNPDAPNKPDWRSSVLVSRDHPYTAKTVYAFHARLD